MNRIISKIEIWHCHYPKSSYLIYQPRFFLQWFGLHSSPKLLRKRPERDAFQILVLVCQVTEKIPLGTLLPDDLTSFRGVDSEDVIERSNQLHDHNRPSEHWQCRSTGKGWRKCEDQPKFTSHWCKFSGGMHNPCTVNRAEGEGRQVQNSNSYIVVSAKSWYPMGKLSKLTRPRGTKERPLNKPGWLS